MNGSIKHVVFGHGYRNFKICNYCVMVRSAICNCGCLNVFTRGASYQDVEQCSCMCFGKLTCCFVSNDARISLNVVVVADGVSR